MFGPDLDVSPERAARPLTFVGVARTQLSALWRGLYEEDVPALAGSRFEAMFETWSTLRVPAAPIWPSAIGADHSPFEFSVALSGKSAELRLLVEAQSTAPGYLASREACLSLHAALAGRGVDQTAFERVQDLFLPDVSAARFALWHACVLGPGSPQLKIYLNPQIRGEEHTGRVVEEAFRRLDLAAAWRVLASVLRERAPSDLKYVGLDLDGAPGARPRVKVYLYPRGAIAGDFERLAALRPGYTAGQVTDFCRIMTGSDGPYTEHPLCVYLAFVGEETTPADVTIQIPMALYAHDDEVVRQRVRAFLRSSDMPTATYDRALASMTNRPLSASGGLQTYVTLRTGTEPPRVTVYFASKLFGAKS
ncbi:MAG TPA: tryptophan dimethylallyltransferase family protein [Polyangiaceae bacterium]|nr:tryptophan dimethylallyltransferase family protein [Polyangiaceae bacterium]